MAAADPTGPLTKEWFDKAAESARCRDGAVLVFLPPCHKKYGARVKFWEDGVVEVRCQTCNAFVLSFALASHDRALLSQQIRCDDPECKHGPDEHYTKIMPACHLGAGMRLTYEGGAVLAKCMRCRTLAWTFHVRAAAEIEPVTTITPVTPHTIKPT